MNDEHDASQSRFLGWFSKLKRWLTGNPVCKEDLINTLRDGDLQKIVDSETLHILEGALQASTMQVRDIMIPRSQMVCIDVNESPKNFLPRIISAGHSRYPVIGDSSDEVIGILLAKDLLPLLLQSEGYASCGLRTIIRPALFSPESKRLNILLRDFRNNRNHMALVADEYGGVAGLVTIEDVLEEIVGEIEDEHDEAEDTHIIPVNEKEFMVDALTPIENFNAYFHCHLNNEECDTIGGVVMQLFGHMPHNDESVNIDQFCFKIIKSDNRRIRLLHVALKTPLIAELKDR